MWQVFVGLIILLVILSFLLEIRRPHKFPPGPDWLPIVGNYLLFRRLYRELGFTHLVWSKLCSIYGPLIGLRLGKDLVVIASGQEAVHEVLTREEFDARPDGFFFRLRSLGQRFGIVFVDGEFFDSQKKFCLKHLKSFGLNRSLMEDRICIETADFISTIEANWNEPVQMPDALELNVLNGLWSMVAGERFKVGDPRPSELVRLIHTVFRLQDMSGGILNQMPYLRFIAPEMCNFNQTKDIVNTLISFLKELIHEHRRTANGYEHRDLIDAYLHEIEKQKSSSCTSPSSFSEDQLVILLLDLLLAGSETTTSTLAYAVLYLLHFPQWQVKLQQELDSILGSNDIPRLHHKRSLKYLQVFLMELQRHANVTPTTVAHRAFKNTEVMGYIIPQDTLVLANLYSLHTDKAHWGDPESFRPERFLGPKGEIISDTWLLPFGTGKRRCIGENLAKTSLFLFLSAILHKFTISSVLGAPIPSLRGHDGATVSPKAFRCVFTPRRK